MTAQTHIDKLIKKINSTDEYFVIAKEKDFVVVGCWKTITVRIEKTGNIFQPFGKNIDKSVPIFFPVGFNSDKKKLNSNEFFRDLKPKCYFHKAVLNTPNDKFKNILDNCIQDVLYSS